MLILSGVLIFIGVAMIIGGMILRQYKHSQEMYQGTAVGKVVEVQQDKPDQEGIQKGYHHYYYPVIAFYANGLLYKARYQKGSSKSAYAVNDEVRLCFDLEKPYHYEIAKRNPGKILGSLIYGAGFVLCIAGGIAFLVFATR